MDDVKCIKETTEEAKVSSAEIQSRFGYHKVIAENDPIDTEV